MPDLLRNRIWKVGLTVVIGLILFYLGIVWAQRTDPFAKQSQEYTIIFDNVNGLLIGDPVTVRGFVSGRVKDILPRAEAVWVTVSLDPKIELREDARAEIQIKELMGGKQVSIHPGAAEAKLQAGSTLPGVASMDFSSSFSEFGAVIEQVNVLQINQLLAKLDTFAGALNHLAAAMPASSVADIVNRMDRISLQVESVMRQADEAQWMAKFESMFIQAERTLQRADTAMSMVQQLGDGWSEEDVRRLRNMLLDSERTLAVTNATMTQVGTLLDTLMSQETLVGQALTDKKFRQRIDSTLYRLDRTLEQIYLKRVIVGLRRKSSD